MQRRGVSDNKSTRKTAGRRLTSTRHATQSGSLGRVTV
jgi:hypothetical protein